MDSLANFIGQVTVVFHGLGFYRICPLQEALLSIADSFHLSRRAILSEQISSSVQPRGWDGFSDSESGSLPPWLDDEESDAEGQ